MGLRSTQLHWLFKTVKLSNYLISLGFFVNRWHGR